jgi:hypothetical protein
MRRFASRRGPGRLLGALGALSLAAALSWPAAALAATGPSAARAAAPGSAPASQATASKVTLKLGQASGLPGQAVRFSGGGFRAGESVAVHWHTGTGPELAKVKATKAGSISGSFKVPLPKAGVPQHTAVVAVGAKSGRKARASFSQDCTDEWTGLSGGNWSNVKDWSAGAVPGPATATCITLPGRKSYTVTLGVATGSTTVGSLRLGTTTGPTTQSLELLPGGSDLHFQLDATSTVEPKGVFVMSSGAGGGNPFLQGNGSASVGTLDNYGQFKTVAGTGWSRYLSSDIVNERGAVMSIAAANLPGGATYQNSGSTLVNHGRITVAHGSSYEVGQATFTQAGGSVSNEGTFEASAATVNKTGGTASGNAWQLYNGVTLHDQAGTGSFTFQNSGTLTGGTIPAGQTVTVDGDASTNTVLALAGNVTNHGSLVLTATNLNGGPGNAMVTSATSAMVTLFNQGTITTRQGPGWSRYFYVNVTNRAHATMNLDAQDNYETPGPSTTTLTNDGTLNLGAGASVLLSGVSNGQADFVQGSGGTLSLVVNGKTGSTSAIHQLGCSAGGCQNESIKLAGTLKVTTTGTPGAAVVPVYSEYSLVVGSFAHLVSPQHYAMSYNQPDAALPTAVGDVILSP